MSQTSRFIVLIGLAVAAFAISLALQYQTYREVVALRQPAPTPQAVVIEASPSASPTTAIEAAKARATSTASGTTRR
jgi:hypothetical protein